MPMVSIQPQQEAIQVNPNPACVGFLLVSWYIQPTMKILANYLESEARTQLIWKPE